MKEAIITDLDGLLADVALVDDSETGYSPIYETVAEGGDLELIGYRVAVPVPAGLYRPRFDREAYDEHQEALSQYAAAVSAWEVLPVDERGELPELPDAPAYWVEGLTQEEIDALQPGPPEPSPAQRIEQLEVESTSTMLAVAEVYEEQAASAAAQEQQTVETMLGLAEAYGVIMQQAELIAELAARVAALEGGGS
ncbi:hypothetical protein HGI30_16690 [Paenibacillus albicereus]|uniref:Bacteriophage SP-beta YorD domain-containing protein n=1 Tax=Paenibacillus albicereus TaxID=2726185 RepID=A0A6H2H121_9BACL|nr:hypothetical protein [Paenibacillus albicereus]QJC53048.1 hypothetical protein HGI30_16690 [Paenibacillus albicereus]